MAKPKPGRHPSSVPPPSSSPNAHHVKVRLESSDFDCTDIEIHKLDGREAISRLFEFELQIVVKNTVGFTRDELAGASVAILFERGSHEVARRQGIVAQVVDLLDTTANYRVYRLTVVPRAWWLSLVTTSEVFLSCNTQDVIEEKLTRVQLAKDTDFRFNQLMGSYPNREFVLQYEESDLDFVSRLAEHVGLCFYFVHSNGIDELVFADHPGGHLEATADGQVPYRGAGDRRDVYRLEARTRLIPQTFVCRDYNYDTPADEPEGEHVLSEGYGGGMVEFGPHARTDDEATDYAKIRGQQQLCQRDVYDGHSDRPELAPGLTAQLDGHPADDPSLLITEVHHSVVQLVSVLPSDDAVTYYNHFAAIPADRTFRPERRTPVPRIHGLVTGQIETVAGDADPMSPPRFPHLDERGRYFVRLLLDTGAHGAAPSLRIRMMQPSAGQGGAGNTYGMHLPLRPGTEVLIAFVNGDPGRPIIVGAAPNPLTATPVVQTQHSKSRIQSESGILFEMDDG